MEYKKFANKFIVRLERGEEIVEELMKLCRKEHIFLGTITGLGAADIIHAGYFEFKTKTYHQQEFKGDFEITHLNGNVSTMKGEVYLHLHITFADEKQRAFGGHLKKAVISGTFEGVIEKIDTRVEREYNDDVGLNLYKF
jgi:predicted DNA-binding protein with PD1-like motif